MVQHTDSGDLRRAALAVLTQHNFPRYHPFPQAGSDRLVCVLFIFPRPAAGGTSTCTRMCFCAARFANRNLFSARFARCVQMKAPCAAPPAKCNSKLMSSTTMTTKGNNGGTWHFLLTHSVDIVGANWAARAPHRPYRVGIGRAAMCSRWMRDHVAVHANTLQQTLADAAPGGWPA